MPTVENNPDKESRDIVRLSSADRGDDHFASQWKPFELNSLTLERS